MNFNAEAKPPVNFDLSVQELEQLNEYSNYRKCAGLKKAYLYDLRIATKGTVISDQLSPSDIENVRNNLGIVFFVDLMLLLINGMVCLEGKTLELKILIMFCVK